MLTPIFSDAELSDCDRNSVRISDSNAGRVDHDGYTQLWPCHLVDNNDIANDHNGDDADDDDDIVTSHPVEDDADVREIVVRLRGLQERRSAVLDKWMLTSSDGDQCRIRRLPCRTDSGIPDVDVTLDDVMPDDDDNRHQFDSMDVVGNEVLSSPDQSLRPDECEATSSPNFTDVAARGASELTGGQECQRNAGDAEDRMNGALRRLRQELASLLTQDGAIFDQLLTLRRSISHLKHQSSLLEEWEDDAEVTYLSGSLHTTGSVRRGRLQRANSVRIKCRRRDSGTNLITTTEHHNNNNVYHHDCDQDCCPTSGEDSAFSLESSGVSSPSLSPSPSSLTAAATTVAPSTSVKLQLNKQTPHEDSTSFIRNNVTFPPSRNRQSRFNSIGVGLSERGRSCSLSTFGVDSLGCVPTEVSRGGVPSRGGDFSPGYHRGMSVEGAASVSSHRRYASPLLSSFSLVRSRSITFLPRGALVRREESCDSGFDGTPSRGEVFV